MKRLWVRGKQCDGPKILGSDLKAHQARGLRMLHLQTMNLALSTKCVSKSMSLETNMILEVLKNSYGSWIDKDMHAAPIREAWPFWPSLKQVILQVQEFFLAKLGDGSSFRFAWTNSSIGALLKRSSLDLLPQHGVLRQRLGIARMRSDLPLVEGISSDPRVEDFLKM